MTRGHGWSLTITMRGTFTPCSLPAFTGAFDLTPPFNTALMSASDPNKMAEARQEPDHWGRWVESAVGSSLANGIIGKNIELFYWSSRNREVDFVLSRKNELVTIEVKSGRNKSW
jgi:hypothetical protein